MSIIRNGAGIVVPANAGDMSRRNFLKRAFTCTAIAGGSLFTGGFVPSSNALAASRDTFDLRRKIIKPLDMWLYTIHMPPEFPSTWQFGFDRAPAIPAGFFGAGSDPWAGTIACVGIPLNRKGPVPSADLIVQHESLEWIPNPIRKYGPREIPKNFRIRCDMKELSERVVEPITVTYDNGKREERWDAVIKLSKDHPGGGYIDITWLNADGNGGLCDIEIAVKVDFIFTKASDRGENKKVVLHSDVEWLSETNHSFVRYADASLNEKFFISPGANGNFIPATVDLGSGMMARGACSKNATVNHSFVLAPKEVKGAWGTTTQIKQFDLRKEKAF